MLCFVVSIYRHVSYLVLYTIIGSKKLSLSESFNDLHFIKHSKGGLAWDVVSPSHRNSNRSPDIAKSHEKSNIEMVLILFLILIKIIN